MTAGTLSLSYTAPSTFTATVTAPAGFNVMNVTLTSPSNSPLSMSNTTYGMNPSTWQCSVPGGGGMPGGPGGAQAGTWTATATLQATATCAGTVTVA